jgi:hypothetical protein
MQTKYPDSYHRFAAAEEEDFSKTGGTYTTENADGTKTSVQRPRLFTNAPAAKAMTQDQLNQTATVAKSMLQSGSTRADVAAALQQKLGPQSAAVMQWLDSQGTFGSPNQTNSTDAITPSVSPSTMGLVPNR